MEKDIEKSFANQSFIENDYSRIKEYFENFEECMMIYNCAIREVRTKFEVLNDDLSVAYNRNPIEMIKSRIKKPQSIINKLKRRGFEISMESLVANLNDVAGIRIICSFVDDIYRVAGMFSSQDDVTVLEIKDYIKHPKENGYRSYHMIVEVPVFFAKRKQYVKVEVQLRTIAMDFWASLEHKIKYKKDVENSEEIIKELKECADSIAQTDLKMQNINNKLDNEFIFKQK